jgi:hypothetical protein
MSFREYLDYWAGLRWRDYVQHVAIYLVVAALLSIIGPFNTYGDPFIWRLCYWLMMLGLFGGTFLPGSAWALGKVERVAALPLVPGRVLLVAIACVPMTVVVALVDVAATKLLAALIAAQVSGFDDVAMRKSGSALALAHPFAYLALYGKVLAISLVSTGLVPLHIIGQHRREGGDDAAGGPVRPGVAFFSRLPEAIGTDLVCLRMEDHYLRVTTRGGEALILMRMRDALRELEGIAGLQVHRSWWVATGEIVRLTRKGRRTELAMSNGTQVPVSSSFRPELDLILRPDPVLQA